MSEMFSDNIFLSVLVVGGLLLVCFYCGILFLSYLFGAGKAARRADKKNDGTASKLATDYRLMALIFLLLAAIAAGIFLYFNVVLDIDFF